jgi:hypothetical protein
MKVRARASNLYSLMTHSVCIDCLGHVGILQMRRFMAYYCYCWSVVFHCRLRPTATATTRYRTATATATAAARRRPPSSRGLSSLVISRVIVRKILAPRRSKIWRELEKKAGKESRSSQSKRQAAAASPPQRMISLFNRLFNVKATHTNHGEPKQ